MAYASKLPEDKFNEIYDALNKHSREASYSRFLANHKHPGIYRTEWSDLMSDWCHDKASNLYVMDCLKVGYVLDPGYDKA